jgi:4-hydroxybenzoate polyprenyltransferase
MKQFFTFLHRSIRFIEQTPLTLSHWVTSFGALILTRILIENWLGGFEDHSISFLFFEFTHTFFFFFLSFLLFWPILAKLSKTSLQSSAIILLFGFIIILTPPLIDAFISGGSGYWSFYKFDSLSGLWHRYFTLFGDRPDIGITYGVRVEVVLTTLFFALFVFLKTNSAQRAFLTIFTSYTLLFFLGTLPSWLTFCFLGFSSNLTTLSAPDIAGFFLSPPQILHQPIPEFINALNIKMSLILAPSSLFVLTILLWRFFPQKFFALLSNARFPQLAYHIGLLVAGAGFACFFTSATPPPLTIFNVFAFLDLLLAVWLAWLASVVVNDLFDQKTDALSNVKRPLPQHIFLEEDYRTIGFLFFGASLIFAALISFKSMLLLLAYQSLAWLYSAQPLRLKRFPLIATLITALASILILLLGFLLFSGTSSIKSFPSSFFLFFLLSLMASLPLKDFKDIEGDRADKVFTLPVLFGEYKAKLIIGSALFFSFLASILILHAFVFWWWALLCGSSAFWILILSTKHHSILCFRHLPAIILSIIFLYSSILLFFLFH